MSDKQLPNSLQFLLAARQRELEELQHLVNTCGLVTAISQLVHELQKERGYSNIYLGQSHAGQLETLESYSTNAIHCEQQLHQWLSTIFDGNGNARLFLHIAHALNALDELPGQRRQIRDLAISSQDNTANFTRLIGCLLAVVFEAADASLDSDITRALIAMFNFMQGKELTGQERAIGVAAFSAGFFNDDQKQQIQQLHEQQQRCFSLFDEHADAAAQQHWQQLQDSDTALHFRQLRLIGQRTSAQANVESGLDEVWFDICTQYINSLKDLEHLLAETLLQRCQYSIERASQAMNNRRELSRQLGNHAIHQPLFFRVQSGTLDSLPPDGIGNRINRSLLDDMQSQSGRLQQLDQELQQTRRLLDERRRIEQAKHRLMKQLKLSEHEAHEHLLRHAMQSGKRLSRIVDEILS